MASYADYYRPQAAPSRSALGGGLNPAAANSLVDRFQGSNSQLRDLMGEAYRPRYTQQDGGYGAPGQSAGGEDYWRRQFGWKGGAKLPPAVIEWLNSQSSFNPPTRAQLAKHFPGINFDAFRQDPQNMFKSGTQQLQPQVGGAYRVAPPSYNIRQDLAEPLMAGGYMQRGVVGVPVQGMYGQFRR